MLTGALSRSALVRGRWASSLSLCIASIPVTTATVFIAYWANSEMMGQKDWYHSPCNFVRRIIESLLYRGYPFMGMHVRHKSSSVCVHCERFIHMPLLWTSLLAVFQPYSLQVPDHPANLLVTAHKSDWIHTSSLLLFQTKRKTCTVPNSAHQEDFPVLLCFRAPLSGG